MINRNTIIRSRKTLAPIACALTLFATGPALAGLHSPADTSWFGPQQLTAPVEASSRGAVDGLYLPVSQAWMGQLVLRQATDRSVMPGDHGVRTVTLAPGVREVRVTGGERVRFIVPAAAGVNHSFVWQADPVLEQGRSVELHAIAPAGVELPAGVRVWIDADGSRLG